NGYSPGNTFGMGMGDFGSAAGIVDNSLNVTSEISPQRCNSHGCAVAIRAGPAKKPTSGNLPVNISFELLKQATHGRPIFAIWVVASGEAHGEVGLIDFAVISQVGVDGECHLCVVGIGPGWCR